MPDPSTSRLGLYKSKSDGSELVSYSQDIGQNLDKLDLAAGFQAATSTTRPATPYSGKPIFETDTSYRTYFSNGTAPASASWVEIPNGSAQYNSTLRLASGRQINVGASGSTATIAVTNAATTTDLLSARVTGDTQDRFEIDTDGTHLWGPGGSTAPDVNLYRSGVNSLATDDNLSVALNLTVGGIGQERYILKAADTARTSTTTAADDPHLTATLAANGIYIARFVIFATTALSTVNLKTAWGVPGTATGLKLCHGPTDVAAAFTSRTQTQGRFSGHGFTTSLNYQADSLAVAIIEEAIVTTGATAGNLTLQWAQTTSSASAVTVLANSYLHIRRIG
ncbi:hypothetical protein [Streptomyces sp. NPDC085596]|uniref:hypothetical protein n=1 Tax=Streptomyces sp. NPDC085596 TaxID=3365731 RepID=UPI0037D5A25D